MSHSDDEYKWCLFRYVPNVVSGEFLNIGLMMRASQMRHERFADLRFRQDWSRVFQFDPNADMSLLSAVCSGISNTLQGTADWALAEQKLEHSLANVVQMSDRWTIRTENPTQEMDRLVNVYLGPAPVASQRALPNMFERVAAYRERVDVPHAVLGMVAAGEPIEAIENPETISLNDIVRRKKCFVLKVRGESMQDEHIVDGDYVFVETTKNANNGDIVVALVNGNDATLKRFYPQGDTVRLQPSNVNMAPIIVPADAVEIQGKVVGILRKY